jgi:hypothetical protein
MGEQGTDLFKVLVWDSLVKFAISRLFAARPFLSWGPVGVIVGWALNLLADKLYAAADEFVDMTVIPIRNTALRAAYDRESVRLKLLARDKGLGSAEYLKAREDARKAHFDLVRIRTAS